MSDPIWPSIVKTAVAYMVATFFILLMIHVVTWFAWYVLA